MAQNKSAIKAHKQSIKKALRNKQTRSKIKTVSKKIRGLVGLNDFTKATEVLRKSESIIMKAVTKKVLKLNTASRKISKMTHLVKSLESNSNHDIKR
jgi:small subunit ribosomal protein S20